MRDSRPDLGIPEDRRRIYFHLGVVISMANSVDARMVQVGSYLLDPKSPNDGRALLASTWEAKKKRSALQRIFPAGWVQGKELLEGIRQCAEYRNSMGHASLEFDLGAPPDMNVKWLWRSLGRNGTIVETPVDIHSFDGWELRFRAIEESFKFIVGPARYFTLIDGFSIDQIDIANSLKTTPAADWSLVPEDLTDQWNSAIAWLYPSAAIGRKKPTNESA